MQKRKQNFFSLQNTSMQTFQFSHAAFLKQKTKRNEVICKYFMFYCFFLLLYSLGFNFLLACHINITFSFNFISQKMSLTKDKNVILCTSKKITFYALVILGIPYYWYSGQISFWCFIFYRYHTKIKIGCFAFEIR